VLLLSIGLMTLAAVSVSAVLAQSSANATHQATFVARQIAESAASIALTRIKEGGELAPRSETNGTAGWVDFAGGQMYFEGDVSMADGVGTIRAWGRVAVGSHVSKSNVAPDDSTWDGTDWLVRGIEFAVRSSVYLPETPLYCGNGGFERPLGGFDWTSSVDATDPSTWVRVKRSPASYQTTDVPFQVSALDHSFDYLYHGGDDDERTPAPSAGYPHPFPICASQTDIGQFNMQAWFEYSAGSSDPTSEVTPAPTSTYFDISDATSDTHPYPVISDAPDVQEYAWDLWNRHHASSKANRLGQGSHSGEYGNLSDPRITFVTGNLTVPAGKSLTGAGILVIRDDYDPNTDTNNTPRARAGLTIGGAFE